MKINLSKTTVSVLVAALAISASFAQDVPDVNHAWNGPPGSGPSNDWFDTGNWLPTTLPLSTDNAQISNGGTATVTTHAGNATAQDLALGFGAGTSGNLTVINAGVLNVSRDFFIGDASSSTLSTAGFRDTAIVTTGRNAAIGNLAGSLGQVRLQDTAHWTITNNLAVGLSGDGAMQIRDMAKVLANGGLVIGDASGAHGMVDVQGTFSGPSGSQFNLESVGNLVVGNTSALDNSLDIHNGGRVATDSSVIVGNNNGSNGRVRVGDDGPNSESYFFIQNNLSVGDAGTGDFRVVDGGFAGTFGGTTSIGRLSTGVGTMLVTGSGLIDGGSLFTTNNMFVGDAGNGRLEISDLGIVTATGLVAGNQTNSVGRIDVSGAYAINTADYNLTSSADTTIGRSGNGEMDIHDGARVHTVGTAFIGSNSDGTGLVMVGGDGANSEAFWRIGGGLLARGTAGSDAASSAIAGNSPSGNPSNLIVGNNGNGTLQIHDGGVVNVSGNVSIGMNGGSVGRVSVDGSGGFLGNGSNTNSTLLSFGPNGIFVGGNTGGPGGEGELRITNGGTVGSVNGITVWGPGTGAKGLLEVDHTYTISGAPVSVPTTLITFDGGVLRFLDDTDFINDATLGNTQSPNGVFVDTNGTTSTISSVFSGPGGLVKRDDGTLIMTNTNTYTGDTLVHQGTLQLDGSITSNTDVDFNGTLTGTGTIFGNLRNRGVVSPGHSPGTLTVSGNYLQTSNGDFEAEVGGLNSGVDSDLLTMGGTGSLDGSIHVIRINNFNPVPGDRVTVLNANGGLGGTQFATFTPVGWLGLIQPTLDYATDPDHVDVVFELTATFASQGLTRNEICVGENLDAAVDFVNTNEAAHNLIGVLGQLPPDQLPEAFNLIAPEEYASIYEISFQHGIMEMGNYRQRMDDLRATARGYCEPPQPMVESGGGKGSDGKTVLDGKQTLPDKTVAPADTCPDQRWGMFATGYGQGINVGDDQFNDVHGYDIMTGGFSTGFDALVTRHFAIGVGGGYASSQADLVNDGRVNVETAYVAGYSTFFMGGFYVDGAASFGWNSIDASRLGFGGIEDGSTNGSEFNGIIGGGYDWKTHCWTIGPFATFHYTYVQFDSFDESGGSLAPLHFPDQNQDAERGAIGLKVAYDMTRGNIIFRPEVRAAFQHEFNNTDYAIDFGFRDIPTDHICDVFGPSTGQDSALIDAGFSLILGKCHNVSAFAFYSGNIGRDNDTRHGVNGGLRLSF